MTITDKDGTSPGHIDGNPYSDNFWHFGEKEILSNTNIVSVQFKTDAISDEYSFGWRLMWGEENFIFSMKTLVIIQDW